MTDTPEPARQTVWVVTSGSYSDYGINAIYATEAHARAHIDIHRARERHDDYNDPEEWTLGDTTPVVTEYWLVFASSDSTPDARQEWTTDWHTLRHEYPCATYNAHASFGHSPHHASACAVALDKDVAIKAARDARAQMQYEHATNGATRIIGGIAS